MVKKVGEDEEHHYTYRVDVIEVNQVRENSQDNMTELNVNGQSVKMFVDSGCKKTLMPVELYKRHMGELRPTNVKLRPYGTDQYLNVQGQLQAEMKCKEGATITTTIYVVKGHLAEALLGDEDAKALGILQINPQGANSSRETLVAGITSNIRENGIKVQTHKRDKPEITLEERERMERILARYPQVLKSDEEAGIGLLKDQSLCKYDTVKFHIDPTVPPRAASYKPPPVAYQERLSAHLQELRTSGKIEDVGPDEHCPWVSNVVITEKKQSQKNQIRMNIDMREANKALLCTKRHIETVQEIRHKLKGATRFSEMDLGHGYHQIALAEESRYMSTFQTHEGLHRFKVLFFGASPASELFHDRIKSAVKDLPGVISIHDNILVWGRTDEEHEENLEKCLQRLAARGITVRYSKSNFGVKEVGWFGWVFSEDGMSADPEKIQAILEAGPPQSTDDVKSFLQACQFNARFMIESEHAYAQLTEPLRKLTRKNARFQWTEDCEQAYQQIMHAMTSHTALRPFDPSLKTTLVTDAGPAGIAASIFQVGQNDTWYPIDHASRALTPCEQKYSQIEKESLGQAWGMTEHRHYLLGIEFVSYTDHQPLIPIYTGNRKGNARIERHRLKVQGFQYDMKYMPGKDNPCDYQSRHPRSLENFTQQHLDDMMIDYDEELCITRIVTDDLPDAVTIPMVQQATKEDPTLQKLIKAIQRGYIKEDEGLKDYRQIFHEITYAEGVLLRDDRLIIPDAELMPGTGSLRQLVVDTAHEGHQGVVKCKQLLRTMVWFPGMDHMVERKIANCVACQATTYTPTRDPLKPTVLPERPWQCIDMDFWGPLPGGESVLVMIDKYSRFPEVEFVSGTSAQAVVPHIDRVFATHGFPEKVKTDGGPPFNGTDTHAYKEYMKWAGVKARVVTPEDPEANGLAENFMKSIKKVWHCARIEGKHFKQELYKFLRQYRATPHSSTRQAPATLLFNRTFQTRLPAKQKPVHDPELRAQNAEAKEKQKMYKDSKANVRPHVIQVGDHVLLLQKESKTRSRYEPDPYRVTEVQGSQITAVQGDKIRRRDAQKFKKVDITEQRNYRPMRNTLNMYPHEAADVNIADDTHGVPDVVALAPAPQEAPRAYVPPAPQEAQRAYVPPHRRAAKTHQYPNKVLDPNVDVTLARGQRNRRATQQYNAKAGQWN